MVSNEGWSEDQLQPCTKGMHTNKETDILTVKMDLLLKRMDVQEKARELALKPVHAIDSHFTCEVCGSGGHSGNDCPVPMKIQPS
jgi:hypothetical protein